MAPRETENNAYAKFWGDKQRTLWYVMVFLEWSIAYSICFHKTVHNKWCLDKTIGQIENGLERGFGLNLR